MILAGEVEEAALSGYRYSAGNAMGIVVVIDWEQGKCCALPNQMFDW
jgi:hypothetical protein